MAPAPGNRRQHPFNEYTKDTVSVGVCFLLMVMSPHFFCEREFILLKLPHRNFKRDIGIEQTYRYFCLLYHFLGSASNRETPGKIRSP